MLIEPSRLQAIFEDVYGQMHRLHTHWWLYRTFFGTIEATQIVRRDAKFTFGTLQALLIEGIVLGLTRLLAKASNKQKDSSSVATLLRDLPSSHASLRREMKKVLARVVTDCTAIDDWRDEVVAHRNLDVALQYRVLDRPRVETVRRALEELSKLLTRVSVEIGAGLRCDFYPDTPPDVFDADCLLERLKPRG